VSVLRVLVVDDEAITRHGVRMILDHDEAIEVVGEATDGAEGVQQARILLPDVVLLDIRMPGMNGLQAIAPIVATGARVLVLTTYDVDENIYRAFRAGASGFVLKTARPEDLVYAVRVVARGDALVEPGISRRLVERFVARAPDRRQAPWIDRLSERESDVLREMARGSSNAEIARTLHISEATVKTHVTGVLGKLNVRDRLQAVVRAYESGFVSIG